MGTTQKPVDRASTGGGPRAGIAMIVVALAAACAPTVDGPVERQRAVDRADGVALEGQLAVLPGAITARATLHRAVRDPLGVAAAIPASAAVLVVVDDRADRTAITRAAFALVRATAPEIPTPTIVVEVGATRPALATVGPFTVETGSKDALRAVLASGLALIAGLATWIAIRERRQARA